MGRFTEEEYAKIAKKYQGKYGNDSSDFGKHYDDTITVRTYGYDEYLVHVLDFEFIVCGLMYFEDKENRFGNKNLFYKGDELQAERKLCLLESLTRWRTPRYTGSYMLGNRLLSLWLRKKT